MLTPVISAIRPDGSVVFTADQSMNSHKLTNLASGTISTDAINLAQLNAALSTIGSTGAITDATGTLLVTHGGTGLATLTNHALYVGNGASAPTAIAVGTTNTVLHGNTGANPSFSAVVEADITLADNVTNNVGTSAHGFAPKAPNDATKYLDGTGAYSTPPGTASLVLLEQHTASSSAELDFTASITSAYDEYVIEFVNLVTSASAKLGVQFSVNGGSSYDTANNYAYYGNYSYSGGGGAISVGSDSGVYFRDVASTLDANYSYNFSMRLFGPLGSLYKVVAYQGSLMLSGNSLFSVTGSGVYKVTTAVNALRVLPSAGNLTSGIVRVYGVAK